MKKLVFVLLTAFFLCQMTFFASGAVSETDDGLFYSIENGEVTIEGFNYVGMKMVIPEEIEGLPVKYIAHQACRGNEAIKELKIPASVEKIGEYAFAECKNLSRVSFEDGATEIGYSSFRDCKSLTAVKLPDTLKIIEDCAFSGCILLGKLKIPISVTEIGVDAFIGCSELRLDVGENKIAAEYAERYSIPADFTSSWTYTVILLVLATAVLGAAMFFLDRFIRNKRKNQK